ncbi:MAG TPA: hypothetical protein VFF31_00755 [Blastocatellia bacterium]|nr:hypothetical protein [Blastocatellia bacterium]
MSNYAPPTAPMGGPAGQPFPPQQSFPPPPEKKSKVLVWVLAGCGTFVVLGVIAVMALSYFVWNKAREIEKNPAFAIAKMAVSVNPDVELVSADEEKGLLTIKDKKTGEVITVNFEDVKDGKVTLKKDGEDEVTFEAKGDESKGSLVVKSAEGTAKFGSGSVERLPDWLPAYPDAKTEGSYSAQNNEGESGGFHFLTKDPPNKVIEFYRESLERAGLTVTTNLVQQSGRATGGMAAGEDSNKKRSAYVNAVVGDDGTRVNVAFTTKR